MRRFWGRVDKGEGCWIWCGYRNSTGYGQVEKMAAGKRYVMLCHRVAWSLENGPVPEGMLILHSCDNPRCVNPGHLRVGTVQENATNRMARGRHVVSEAQRRKGPTHPAARYTQAERDEAVRLVVGEWLPYREASARTGVPKHSLFRWVKEKYGTTRGRRRTEKRPWLPGYTLVNGKPTYTG